MVEKRIIPGKIGGWRPNSGRKPGFVGFWKGKKRPGVKWEQLKPWHKNGKDNYFANKKYKGASHANWKGDKVGYYALHIWLKRELGRPDKCSNCKKKCKPDWANKSHEYKRDLDDWFALCKKCHYHYDRNGILL